MWRVGAEKVVTIFPGNVILVILTMNIKFQYLYILKYFLWYAAVQFLQLCNFDKDKRQEKAKTSSFKKIS